MGIRGVLIQVSEDKLWELVATPTAVESLLSEFEHATTCDSIHASTDDTPIDLPRFLTLERAWDAMRVLLREIGPPPMARLLEGVVLGNQQQSLGVDAGFGPATFLRPDEVAKLADLLSACSPSAVADFVESGQLEDHEVHGNFGRSELALLLELLQNLKEFYTDAARAQRAVVAARV